MEIIFLDTNILFSVAWKEHSLLKKLWEIPNIALVSSAYATEEARRNFLFSEQKERLEFFLKSVRITHFSQDILPSFLELKAKDRPILSAAIQAQAKILLTGDIKDFGIFFEKTVLGVQILPPALYFAQKNIL